MKKYDFSDIFVIKGEIRKIKKTLKPCSKTIYGFFAVVMAETEARAKEAVVLALFSRDFELESIYQVKRFSDLGFLSDDLAALEYQWMAQKARETGQVIFGDFVAM